MNKIEVHSNKYKIMKPKCICNLIDQGLLLVAIQYCNQTWNIKLCLGSVFENSFLKLFYDVL